MTTSLACDVVVRGALNATALRLVEPLSFWGGFDPATGTIIDQYHPQCGTVLAGAVVVMHAGRGSSSASSVIAEAARAGCAPAGFVLAEPDEIIVLGALVASELYGTPMAVVVSPVALAQLRTGDNLRLADDALLLEAPSS